MGAVEIILLLAGGIIFIVSFIIPVKAAAVSEDTKQLAREEIKELVKQEIEHIRTDAADVVDETVNYAVEKAERSLERLSNEKIMAVNEYSDSVLGEINRNHNEVMFLYDMLTDKHKQIVNTVSEVQKTVKKAEHVMSEEETKLMTQKPAGDEKGSLPVKAKEAGNKNTNKREVTKDGAVSQEAPGPNISFMGGLEGSSRNSNEKILELHNAGKSNIAIAQELGLGVGEVKLVIDLFEGM